jgi:phosphoglycolate phosphatase-like HAD superfamily hydrolase
MAHSSAHRNERRLVCERAAAGDGPAGDSAAGGKFQKFHSEAYLKQVQRVQPLPGAKELLKSLTKARVRWAIATSGRIAFARPSLDALEVPSSVPIITRDQVERAKRHCELHRCRRPPWGSACRTEGAGFGSGSFIRRVWAG